MEFQLHFQKDRLNHQLNYQLHIHRDSKFPKRASEKTFRAINATFEFEKGFCCPKKIKVTEAILNTKKKILQELHTKKEQETV